MFRYKRIVKKCGFFILIFNLPIYSTFSQNENLVNINTAVSHVTDISVLIDICEEFPLENCYVVQVDFQTISHIDSTYDWLSQAFLVNDKGELIKSLTWLELLSIKENRYRKLLSGLLIFPEIPVLKLGLTLRLLRENGDGYDSFTVDVPSLQDLKQRR